MALRTEIACSVGAGYDALAEVYDQRFADEARAAWHGGLLRLATLGLAGARVLELGAGTGVGGRLLRSLGPAQLVGFDISASMLARAGDAYDSVIVGNLERLPFATGTFDLCVAGFDTINHLPLQRLQKALAKANLGRVSPKMAIDCFTRESEEALLTGTRGHRLERQAPGILVSTHRIGNSDVRLRHFLPPAQELYSCLETCGWRVVEAINVLVGGKKGLPGHQALSLQRV